MKKETPQPLKITDVLRRSCLYFAPIFFLINLICVLATGNSVMLVPWASALIFALTYVIALIVTSLKKPKHNKKFYKIVTNTSCIFSSVSFLITLVVYLLNDGSIWNIWGLLLVLFTSALISVLIEFLTIKSFLIKALIFYAVSVSSFICLITAVGHYTQGNVALISFSIYSAVYVVSAIIFFVIKRLFEQFDNEEKEYKRQFD